jgi:methyl-accepting chemotaxis protein
MAFIMKFCLLVIIGAVLSSLIIYLMSRATVTTSFENSRLIIKSTADFILPAVLLSSAVVILGIGIAMFFVTLYTSHKIAGPLYRLEKDIKELASGNLKKTFHLREKDEIKALAESLQEMAHGFHYDIDKTKNGLDKLSLLTDQAVKSSNPLIIKEIQNNVQELKNNLSKYTT